MTSTCANVLSRFRRWRGDASGVAGIEMALVFPLMLILFVGLVDFGNALSASRRVATTANIVGDLVTQQSGGTISKSDLQSLFAAAKSTFAPYDTQGLAVEVIGYTRNNNTVTEAWRNSNGTNCASPPPVDMTRLNQLSNDGNDVVVARVCYTVSPLIGMVLKKDVELKEQLMLRPRYSLKLACKDC